MSVILIQALSNRRVTAKKQRRNYRIKHATPFQATRARRTLVFYMGLFGSADNWFGVAPKLAEKFHVSSLICEITGSRRMMVNEIIR